MNSFRQTGSIWRFIRTAALAGCALAASLRPAGAYVLSGYQWPNDQPIVLDLQLGSPASPLEDGSTTWNQVAAAAAGVWNPYLHGGVQFQTEAASYKPARDDYRNTVFFSSTVYGEAFGSDVLAITLSSHSISTGLRIESDVIFNNAKAFDSYRGPLQTGATGYRLYDLRRIAIHEFGHVLGLDHTPQSAVAIMAPYVTDLDTVQADDIAGVYALYGPPAAVAPVITSALGGSAGVGKTYSYRITAQNAPASYQASGLPDGLSLNPATGYITGTPAAEGRYSVTLAATNSAGTGTATLILTVSTPPVITSSLSATALLGQPFHYQITASHQPTGYTLATPPGGLSFDPATGLLSGQPAYIGTFLVQIGASNGGGSGQAYLSLTVGYDAAIVPVYTFTAKDGLTPAAPLLQTADGSFYGTTQFGGGTSSSGSVFRLAPDGTLTTLHTFNGSDGRSPATALARAADGTLYGTTQFGGAASNGTVFKLAPDGTFTTLHSFTFQEGGISSVPLLLAADGNLYGVSGPSIGAGSGGSVFKLTPAGVLTTFHALKSPEGYGASGLIQGPDGSFYGTTSSGTGTAGGGTFFRLAADGTLTTLHSFTLSEGSSPNGVIPGADGNFYGVLANTDFNGPGAAFKMTPGGALTILHRFTAADGTGFSTLTQGKDGAFYGTTRLGSGTQSNLGTLFKIAPDGTLTTLHRFDSSFGSPASALIQGGDGEFYGVTGSSGTSLGSIYRTNLHASAPVLVTLAATTPSTPLTGSGGVFTITLSAPQPRDLLVYYTLKGSAVNGKDYAALKGVVKVKAGKTSKAIKVAPLGDLGGAAVKAVKLTLAPDATYTVGTTTYAKVKILSH